MTTVRVQTAPATRCGLCDTALGQPCPNTLRRGEPLRFFPVPIKTPVADPGEVARRRQGYAPSQYPRSGLRGQGCPR